MGIITELTERLRKKGWSLEEIENALGIIGSEEKKKKHFIFKKSSNRVLYWMSILFLVVINILISAVLIPLLIVLKGFYLYLVVILIALVLGLVFNFLIIDIENLERKHHLFAAFFIPLIAIINLFLIVDVANKLSILLKINTHNNPLIISMIYVIVFLLPYLVSGARIGKGK